MRVTQEIKGTGENPTLTWLERTALDLGRFINERETPKALQRLYHQGFGKRWLHFCVKNLLHVEGLEIAKRLAPGRGVLMCANHRSFFDQYLLSLILVRETDWARDLYFPVRSNFFYESLTGVAVNLLVGGGVMYPPIFRDPAKSELNRTALDKVTEFLKSPGSVVGIHPEGTRGKGSDPYKLLPAQPGVGKVAMHARPTILPVWINGLSNSFAGQVMTNFKRPITTDQRIVIVFGDPVDLGPLGDERPRPAVYKRVADHILSHIARLGERERQLRAKL
ncbi:MAG: 1-acyl-sn-glycerol-3-phosphate acyltransferase [Deltaproteobacteria bacterium]|nr:1-acyl-sn-glycerol-3-phosphate acyltransferase [Deltaproteobacteria bacterium]